MFRKAILALTAVLAVSLVAPSEALAWRGGWGGWRGPGWGWGAVGVGVGLGLAAATTPYYWGGYPHGYGYPYGYTSYYGNGGCYFTTQRVITPWGRRWRQVQVCH